MSNNKHTIGIIGGGVVGQAVAGYFPGSKIYDKYKTFDPLAAVLVQDLIFVCVPTPYNNGFDRSILDEVFSWLAALENKIIVIKSTALPGTTDYYQGLYPKLKIFFNPEFLTEKTARQDFVEPDKQLVGYTAASQDVAAEVLSILPAASYQKIMPARAAELVKYAINSFYATKVIFGNLIYDLAEALGVSYDEVKSALVADKRITDSHFDVWHGGYRGYDGKCLPKDLLSLVGWGKERGVDVSLLETVHERNEDLKSRKAIEAIIVKNDKTI